MENGHRLLITKHQTEKFGMTYVESFTNQYERQVELKFEIPQNKYLVLLVVINASWEFGTPTNMLLQPSRNT